MIARLAYGLLWWLATPLILARLAWRSRRQAGYLERVGERFGAYPPVETAPRIWVHAVSVGETRAAAVLIGSLLERFPGHRVLLTHMTPTGRATGVQLLGDRVERAWLPYDYGFATRRFLAHYRPRFGVIMETELWPRLLQSARSSGVPVLLANARLSERSAARYARWPSLTRWALSNLSGIAAQGQSDAERFSALGARSPQVTGNIKFDLDLPEDTDVRGADFRDWLGRGRRVVVAGSTREGEEALLLDALAEAADDPALLLVIVPRHPQRFNLVAALAGRRFDPGRRSQSVPVPASVRVVVGDSMGEMLAYYGAADVVLMGGSFLDFGSQNLIEACAVGKPVIVGPSTFNFEEASKSAIHAGAAIRVRDVREAMATARTLLGDEANRIAMGAAARSFAEANRGALSRLCDWIVARARPGGGS